MNNNQNSNQEQNNNEKKIEFVEVEQKSAMPIMSFGISFVLLSMITRLNNPTKLVLILVLSFIVYQIVRSKFPPKKIEVHMSDEPEPVVVPEKKEEFKNVKNPELRLINERIDLYFIEIKLLNDSIDDAFISAELAEIESTLKKMQVQINDESKPGISKRIEHLNDFFDYYMPTTIKILNSYRKIESQHLTGSNASETKKRVEDTLPLIKKAFYKELDNMFSSEMMDITTDIDVLESMLSKDGLIDKDNIRKTDIF